MSESNEKQVPYQVGATTQTDHRIPLVLKEVNEKLASIMVFQELDLSALEELEEEVQNVITVVVTDAYAIGALGGIGSDQFNRMLNTLCAKGEVIREFLLAVSDKMESLSDLKRDEDFTDVEEYKPFS